jgi:hypothetical protein
LFKDDAACSRYLEGAKWPKGFVCPHCDEKGEPFRKRHRLIADVLDFIDLVGGVDRAAHGVVSDEHTTHGRRSPLLPATSSGATQTAQRASRVDQRSNVRAMEILIACLQ